MAFVDTGLRHCPRSLISLQLAISRYGPVFSPSANVCEIVMWSETKKLVLVLQFWCCFVKHALVTLVVIMILKDTATFRVLFIVSLSCAWNISTVKINSGVHLIKSQICEVPLFTSGSLDLGLVILVLILVLDLRIWFCLHHCN